MVTHEHIYNHNLGRVNPSQAASVLAEAEDAIRKALSCQRALDMLSTLEDEDDEDVVLELLSDAFVSNTQTLENYVKAFCPLYPGVQRLTVKLFNRENKDEDVEIAEDGVITTYNALLTPIARYAMLPAEEEIKALRDMSEQIISVLAYFIFLSFDIGKSDTTLDITIKVLCDNTGRNVEDFIATIEKWTEEHPVHLPIFEEYPMLEAEFAAVVGPLLGDFSDTELTLEMVMAICVGDLSPADALQQLNAQTDDSADLNDIQAANLFS